MNETLKVHQRIAEAHSNDTGYGIDDALVEKVWHGLGGQVPRARIYCVLSQIAQGYRNARVTAFLPILVERRALVLLRQESIKTNPTDNCFMDE